MKGSASPSASTGFAMAHPFLDGTAIALHRDVGVTCDSLEGSAPGAGRAWQALVAPLLRRRETVLCARR